MFWESRYERLAKYMHVWFKGAIPWAWVPGPHDWEAEVNGLMMMNLVSNENYDMAKYNRFKWEGR